MSTTDPRSWLDQIISLCTGLLMAAAAIFLTVRLIEAVWVALLVIVGVVVLLVIAGLVLRARNQGW